ncbi:MAG: hypothetical protein L3J81_05820, partial [Thermoplasmata archaeon]|nr:hypothetical protein [Thermoplasmata archaeon]
PGELLVAVHFPSEARTMRATYRKLRVRPSFDFPELGVAAAARLGADGLVERLAVSVGGTETFPKRFDDLTSPLLGARPTLEKVRDLAAAVQKRVRPVHNTFLAADYRKKMTSVFVRRAVGQVLGVGEGRP